jgi:membrane-bound inhibitor of C-type lysozyme
MRALFSLAPLVFAAACQTPCPAPNAEPVTRAYACDDGSTLQVTFTRAPEMAHIEQEGYLPVDLPARITGLGYRYSDGGAELRGHAGETLWSRPGAAETACRAVFLTN